MGRLSGSAYAGDVNHIPGVLCIAGERDFSRDLARHRWSENHRHLDALSSAKPDRQREIAESERCPSNRLGPYPQWSLADVLEIDQTLDRLTDRNAPEVVVTGLAVELLCRRRHRPQQCQERNGQMGEAPHLLKFCGIRHAIAK